MVNLATRYFVLGQKAFADALRMNTICLSCAARLARIQAGAAGALFAPTEAPLRADGEDGGRDPGTTALLRLMDEANETLVDAQSQLRSIMQSRWTDLASELTISMRGPGSSDAQASSPVSTARSRAGAGRADSRVTGYGGARP